MPAPDFRAILRALHAHAVEFIIVGGVGAVLHGVPVITFDLDVVHSTGDKNVTRLRAALEKLDGGLNVLGAIGDGRTYADLLPDATLFDIGEDIRVRVLKLQTLIAIKEELGRDKDRAVLPILRRTLAERNES